MTQLIVSIENRSLTSDIKRAIELLRGVCDVEIRDTDIPNATTLAAFREAEEGHTIVCESMEEYLRTVNDEIQD